MLRIARSLGETGTLRVVGTFLGAHEFPDEFRDRREDYIELLINEMLPAIAKEQLAEYADVFCEPHIFDIDAAARIMTAASKLGFGLRMHVDQLSSSGGEPSSVDVRPSSRETLRAMKMIARRVALSALASACALTACENRPILLPPRLRQSHRRRRSRRSSRRLRWRNAAPS